MSLMNKSEVNRMKFNTVEENTGWTCPRCGKVWSPSVKTCTCQSNKQEAVTTQAKWIKD